MPAPVKKYDARADVRTEGPIFEIWDETFHCVAEAPGALMSTLVAGVDYDANGNEVYRATNVNKFLEMVLLEHRRVARPVEPKRKPKAKTDDAMGDDEAEVVEDGAVVMIDEECDDLQRWRLLMQDKDRPVPLALLVDIVMDLSKYYTERPTAPSRR